MSSDSVTLERDGHVLLIGLNRPQKRNSFDRAMLADLSRAYALLESDDSLRAGVLFAHGDHFTAGLDLVDVGPGIAAGDSPFPDDGRDPWRLDGTWTTPLVAVANGWCMTLGIELLLAADIRIAAAGTRFTQLEVQRGIYPFGGATIRFPREAGWGNAMRWLLTGDEFDAAEAHRIGLVNIVCPGAELEARSQALAQRLAANAPLGVAAGKAILNRQAREGYDYTIEMVTMLQMTEDRNEGVNAFKEKREPRFKGK